MKTVYVSNNGDIDALKQRLTASGFDITNVTFEHVVPLVVKNVQTATHWPWNGEIDVTCDLTGAGEVTLSIALTTNDITVCEATTLTGATVIDLGAGCTTNGVRLVWDAKADFEAAGLTGFNTANAKIKVTASTMGSAVDPEAGGVQLWAGGPYWAECNVGATNPEDYGNLYLFSDDKAKEAAESLGAGWRLPTKDEFTNLLDKCDSQWDTTKRGYTFTGKDTYASKSVFFRAAGRDYDNDGRKNANYEGNYWSSTEGDPNSAWILYFSYYSSNPKIKVSSYEIPDNALSVRAVRDAPSPALETSAESEAFAFDLRTNLTLNGNTAIAGVSYSDTAWGAEAAANVTLGYTNETTGATGELATDLSGSGEANVSLPTKNGAYKLTHSMGGLTTFVTFTVTGYPTLKIPAAGAGYTYVVSNETAESVGELVDGTNTYVVTKGDRVKVYFTLDEHYEWTGEFTNPLDLGAIESDRVVSAAELPTAKQPPVEYLDWDDFNKEMTNATATAYEVVANEKNVFEAGKTYVVFAADVQVSSRITVNGTAANPTRLILCDGAKLTAANGIKVTVDDTTTNVLVICGQTAGTGELSASGGNNNSGIGGGYAGAGGRVTINGGVVTAEGGEYAAGIGGGNGGSSEAGIGGVVTINGGTVVARGGTRGGGIGGGMGSVRGGVVTINGGTLTAEGGANAAAIGGDSIVSADPGKVIFGANFAGGVLAGADEASAVYLTAAAYAADHRAKYVAMPIIALKIPAAGAGYTYVVSNETAELTGELVDGTNTYVVTKGDVVKVYFTLEENYKWSGEFANPMDLGAIEVDTVVNAANLPTAQLSPLGSEGNPWEIGSPEAESVVAFTNGDSNVYFKPARAAVSKTGLETITNAMGKVDFQAKLISADGSETNGLVMAVGASGTAYGSLADALAAEEPSYELLDVEGADVAFNAMGGVHANGREVVTNFCASSYALPAVKRDGYALVGWFDGWTNGAAQVTGGQDLIAYEPHTLYARWQSNKPTLSGGELYVPDATNGVPVTEIAAKQYVNQTSLRYVTTPLYLKTIGQRAFMGCTALEKLTITAARSYDDLSPVTVTVGQNAFSGCSSLETVYIAAEIESIGQSAFQNCANLKKIVFFGDGTITYGASAFYRCGYQNGTGALKVYMSSAFQTANAALIQKFKDWNTQLKIIEKVDVTPVEGGSISIGALNTENLEANNRRLAILVKTSVQGTPDPDDVDVEHATALGGPWSALPAEKTANPDGTVLVEVTVPEGASGFFRAVVE